MPIVLIYVNNNMSINKNIIMLLVLIVSGIAGFQAYKVFNSNSAENFESLLIYPVLKTFSGFELTNQKQEKVTIDSFGNHWTLLFFGFTHCPDVCPTTLNELQKTFKLLESKNIKSQPQVMFVSVDSERDTPESLKTYVEYFNPTFNAATGDAANILSIATQVGVAYNIEKHGEGELNYSVDHTAAIFLVNPDKQIYGIFRLPHDAGKMANDLVKVLNK